MKGKVLKSNCFTSKNGKECTAFTVIFDNDEVCKCFYFGSKELKKGDLVEFEPFAFGSNMIPALRPKF